MRIRRRLSSLLRYRAAMSASVRLRARFAFPTRSLGEMLHIHHRGYQLYRFIEAAPIPSKFNNANPLLSACQGQSPGDATRD